MIPPSEFNQKSHKLILEPKNYYLYLFKSNGSKNPFFKIKTSFLIKKAKEVELIEDTDPDEPTVNEIIETGLW